MRSMTLTEDRIAVIPDEPDETKPGDLIKINTKAKTRGTVLMCGPGAYNALLDKLAPMFIKPGDIIMYARFTGGEIDIDGQTCLLMRQCDVLSIICKSEEPDRPEDIQRVILTDKDISNAPNDDVVKSGFADKPLDSEATCNCANIPHRVNRLRCEAGDCQEGVFNEKIINTIFSPDEDGGF